MTGYEDPPAAPQEPGTDSGSEALPEPELVAEEFFADTEGVPPTPEIVDPVAQERDDYKESLQRLQAEFENYRKRVAKQAEELRERAAEQLVGALLPVLDTAELALSHGAGEDVKQLSATLFATLEKEGLEKIDTVGDAFDPAFHDAVAHEPSDEGEGQEVAEVMRSGYRWRGRVLRPAMVKVRG